MPPMKPSAARAPTTANNHRRTEFIPFPAFQRNKFRSMRRQLCPSRQQGWAARSVTVIVGLMAFHGLCTSLRAFADPTDVQKATYTADAPATQANRNTNSRPAADRQPRYLPAAKAKSLPLPPRGAARAADGTDHSDKPVGLTSTFTTGLASLTVVLGLFFAATWAVRRGLPQPPAKLPGEVVEVLGRAPLAGRQFAHLIRCGNKLLLVHLTQGSAETLTEITDPAEVDRIAGLCRQNHPQSTTASFRHIFQQFSREKPTDAEPTL